ncbi:hypothetical protein [Sphingomonas sp.]
MLAADELPIIEAAYRLLADPAAFDELIAAWSARIEAQQGRQEDVYESPQLARASTLVADLFSRMPKDLAEKGVEQYVRNHAGPAVVMTLASTVVAANEAAAEQFGVAVGRQSALNWVDFASQAELEKLRRSARINGNQQHVVLRLAGAENESDPAGLAEARVIRPNAETGTLIFIRALANPWNHRVSQMLREAFGLTDAEVEVARALYHRPDPGRIAADRTTSLRTVRHQLQQIYLKTWVSGQAELVRLVALLCANSADEASPQAAWTDPLGRERIFHDPAGRRIAYSWMGREGGYPAILVHGPLSGYVLAPEVEAQIAEANIQIFTICRPGFGNSELGKGGAVDDGAAAILALVEHLDLHHCLGIGLVNGIVPLAEAAARGPGRFNQLLGIGSTYPLTPADYSTLPPVQRTIIALAHQRAQSLKVIVAAALRFARRFGWEFVLARMSAGVPADMRVIFDPANLPRVLASTSMVVAQDAAAFVRDLDLLFHDFRPALSPRWPLHFLSGTEDPIYPLSGVGEMAAKGLCTYEPVPKAGQRVYDAAPRQVASAICAAVDRTRAWPAEPWQRPMGGSTHQNGGMIDNPD